MLDEVIRYLACPYCGAGLARDRGSLRCGTGHAFDIVRQGYVSLLPAGAKGGGGDTAAMVRARGDFLAAGHFAGLAAGLAQAAADVAASPTVPGCVLDVGAGTGYYERLSATLSPYFELAGRAELRAALSLGHRAIGALAAMGPTALACGPGRACRAHPAAARPGGRHARGDGICLSAACGRPAASRAGYQFSISSASSDSRWMTASGSAAG